MTRRLRTIALVSFLIGAGAIGAMPGRASAATLCTGTLQNQTVNDDVIVPGFPALCTLIGTTVKGNVFVQPTGRFGALNSTITGHLYATRPANFNLDNTKVGGNLSIDGSSLPTTNIGICRSTIGGSVFIQNVNSPQGLITIGPSCDLVVGNTIGGNVVLTNNRTFVDAPLPGLLVQNNTIRGSLICAGNTPPAVATNNTITGQRTGECAAAPTA